MYMIEQGWYSDYRVCGIYDSEEKAKAVVDMMNAGKCGEEASYSEVGLNENWDLISRGMKVFSVVMSRDGYSEVQLSGSLYASTIMVGEWYLNSGKRVPGVHGEVWAKDEKHAVKIMNEHRASAIAQGNL
jgi:hypothetical protein